MRLASAAFPLCKRLITEEISTHNIGSSVTLAKFELNMLATKLFRKRELAELSTLKSPSRSYELFQYHSQSKSSQAHKPEQDKQISQRA